MGLSVLSYYFHPPGHRAATVLLPLVARLALGTLSGVDQAAEGDGGNDEEEGEKAHPLLQDELTGKAAGAAAHEFRRLLGAPEEYLRPDDQHDWNRVASAATTV